MRILISHPNHPAQFRRLLPELVSQGHDVVFLAKANEWHAPVVQGYRLLAYGEHRGGGGPQIHPYLRRLESAVLQGQASYRSASALKQEGWIPDVVISHVGFGNGLYLRDLFPHARRIALFEWYYNADGSDLAFLRPKGVPEDQRLRLRGWNAQILLELAEVDVAVTPTHWQLHQFPAWMHSRFRVIHEGVDTALMQPLRVSPQESRPFGLPQGQDVEVVTYLSRCFEEYRGFPQAMRALAALQKRRPNVHVVLVGSDEIAYGQPRADGRSWREWALQDLELDPGRTHWLGMLQNHDYLQLLACSNVHLYLTVPFVLSWSLLEAMAAGCAIVASRTEPVLEVMEDGVSGLLADFWDVDEQARSIAALLDNSALRLRLGEAAQRAASKYSAAEGTRQWMGLLCEDTDQTA